MIEAFLAFEQTFGHSLEVTAARLRGQEYLLERQIFRQWSTGEVIERDHKDGAGWTRFAFPSWWHYNRLRGLEFFRRAGGSAKPDERLAETVELVRSKRGSDGCWLLEKQYPGMMPIEIDEGIGNPSRWVNLRALRVLGRKKYIDYNYPYLRSPLI